MQQVSSTPATRLDVVNLQVIKNCGVLRFGFGDLVAVSRVEGRIKTLSG